MDNPRFRFIDDETIPLVQEEDYDDCKTADTSRVDEASFTEPDATDATSTLRLRQKIKLDKITALYKHLNVTDDPGFADIDQVMIKKISETSSTELLFLKEYKHWKSLTNKRTGKILAAGTIMGRFDGLKAMKNFLGLDKTPLGLERSFGAATKPELPTEEEMESILLGELSSLVEDIHVKT